MSKNNEKKSRVQLWREAVSVHKYTGLSPEEILENLEESQSEVSLQAIIIRRLEEALLTAKEEMLKGEPSSALRTIENETKHLKS